MKIEIEMVWDFFPSVLLYCKRCLVHFSENWNGKTILRRKQKYSNKILVILDLHICKHITSLANFTIRIILCSPGWVFVDNSYFIFYNSIKVHDIPVRITSENIGEDERREIITEFSLTNPTSRKALSYRTEIFSIINFPIHQVQSSDENQNGKSNQNHFLCLTPEYISGFHNGWSFYEAEDIFHILHSNS